MRMRHIVMWSARFYDIFPHYLDNGTNFGKTLLNIKGAFGFCLQLLSETFFIVKRNERDMIKNVYLFSRKVPVLPIRL